MQHDVVVVAAAGNRGSGTTEVGAPATMPGVLAVAGVDRVGGASFDASSQGITIAVAAPSEDLVGAAPGNTYFEWEGTSGAAPLVAGVVALVRAAHPELDAANVINRLISTATPTGGPVPSPIYGYGLINAAAAVTADVAPVTANPMGDLTEWIRLYRRAEVTPAPAPVATTTPTPSAAPRVDAGPANPLGVLLPTPQALRTVGIPLLVYLIFGGATSVALYVAARDRRRLPR